MRKKKVILDKTEYHYSIKLIIKNKIGLRKIFWIICILLAFLNPYFLDRVDTYLYLLVIGTTSIIIFFIIILINILKIRKYFIKGIYVDGIIYKTEEINLIIHLGLLYPPKFNVFYRYNISGEVYTNSCKIRDRRDLEYLKRGTRIKVLANPINKNDAIILDIFKKDVNIQKNN